MTRLRPKEVFGKFEFRNMQKWGQAGKLPPSHVNLAVDRAVDLPIDLAVDRAVDLPCRLILAWVHLVEFWAGLEDLGRNLTHLGRNLVEL